MLRWGTQRLSFIVCGCRLTPRRRHKEVRAIYQPRALQLFPLWLKGARIPLPDYIYVVITNLTTLEGISRKISHVAFKADIQFGFTLVLLMILNIILFSISFCLTIYPFFLHPHSPSPPCCPLLFIRLRTIFSISIQHLFLNFRLFLSTLFLDI